MAREDYSSALVRSEAKEFLRDHFRRFKPFVKLGDLGGVNVTCVECGRELSVEVSLRALVEWIVERKLIQDAMPEVCPEEREMLISGICPEDWEKLFGQMEDFDG